MFIIAQIPFVDFRLLSKEEFTDCIFPNTFPKKMSKSTYSRYFGEEKNRYMPNQLPLSERQFFDAHKILHIDYYGFKGDASYHPTLLFSRLYEDAQFFHFDIGIRETFKNTINRNDFHQFIKAFLLSPLFRFNAKYDQSGKNYNFLELTEQIRQIYLYATKSKKADKPNDYIHDIILGYPALFITYDKNEKHSFGKAKEVKLGNGIKVRYDTIPLKHSFIDVWFIGKDGLPKYNQDLRNLRIYLSKLHAYKESSRILLEYLKYNGSGTLDMDKVVTFFNYILSHMEKETYYGYHNADFWQLVFGIDHVYNKISWDEYKRQMNAQIREVIAMSQKNNHITITNSHVTGPIITDSEKITLYGPGQDPLEANIREFDAAFSELLNRSQLTNDQMELLNSQVAAFKEYVNNGSPKKEFASTLFNTIKSTFQYVIKNADGIQKLVLAGESILQRLQ